MIPCIIALTSPILKTLATSTVLLFLLDFPIIRTVDSTKTCNKGGRWELLLNSSGVVAMHMALTHHNTVIIFDQTSSGRSGYRMHSAKPCPSDDSDSDSDSDGDDNTNNACWAHSVEYDIAANTIRPLFLKADTWCSSGSFLRDGTLAQTGGHGDGYRKIRYFSPCTDRRCGWTESDSLLADKRWYATNQVLPEKDKVFIVGGLNVFSYEFLPKSNSADDEDASFDLPFLHETRNRREAGDNLYPFVHLSSDDNLFIFANRDSILFNYHTHRVVKKFPRMPGSGPRNYPSTGSSVMLPLDHADGFQKVEILVCGGGAAGAYRAAKDGEFWEGLSSCGRMVVTELENPKWAMEEMPGPRLMSDMLILPTGDTLIINGATRGSAGWRKATTPSYNPYLYKPKERVGKRFSILNPSRIARMYHSSAIVLPDGRILVAGSNPYKRYIFSGVPFPTELRVEAFVPHYMSGVLDGKRAWNVSIEYGHGRRGIRYGEEFRVRFELARRSENRVVGFHVYAPPFATHSLSMSQRMLRLGWTEMVRAKGGQMEAVVVAPPTPVVAPAGYYLLTVVVSGGIPSISKWVRFIHD